MKNKTSSKNVMLYIVLICLLAMVAFYFLIYQKNVDKAKRLKASNASLAVRVDTLKGYYDNEGFYNDEIDRMTKEIDETFVPFPSDVKEENVLALALDIKDNADIYYSGITTGDQVAIKEIDSNIVDAAGIENYNGTILFVQRGSAYTSKSDYFNLKDCVAVIDRQVNKGTIESINYVKNDTDNCLEGTIKYTFFSVDGLNKEYVPVDFKDYKSGLADLFKLRVEEDEETESEE